MGADQSRFDEPLVPQTEPICATEPRFCLQMGVQLRLREKMWSFSGDDFKITDAATGVVYFRCEGKALSLRDKKTLLDNAGQPVLNLKEALISFTDRFTVYAGGHSDRQICKFRTELNFLKAKLSTTFTDVVTRKSRFLVLKGNWREKQCVVYIGEPKQGGIPIAKVYRPTTGRSLMFGVDDYIIEVAPGVDVALMVVMCIALDEHKRDN